MIQFLQSIICVMDHPEFSRKRECFCTRRKVLPESAAVGNGFINPEHCRSGLLFLQLIQDPGNCFICCRNDGIGSGKAGKGRGYIHPCSEGECCGKGQFP